MCNNGIEVPVHPSFLSLVLFIHRAEGSPAGKGSPDQTASRAFYFSEGFEVEDEVVALML